MRQVTSLRAEDTLAVTDWLPASGLPARVVWGEADLFQKAAYGRRLASDLGPSLQTLPRGKHFTPEDHPEIILRPAARAVVGGAARHALGSDRDRGQRQEVEHGGAGRSRGWTSAR